MKLVVNEVVNMVVNILLFSFIPWIIYLFRNKTSKGFFKSTGLFLSKFDIKKMLCIYTIMYLISLTSLFLMLKNGGSMALTSVNLKENSILWNVLYFLLYGIKTGVSEEIFCRGFIGRKLFDKLGFEKGNIVQAFFFGIIHIVNLSQLGILQTIHRILNAFVVGLVFGYVMEKEAEKSIVPGIVAHASYNAVSSAIISLFSMQ